MQIKNILVIEDDEVASMLLGYLIEDVFDKSFVVTKRNGKEGLAYLAQAAANSGEFPSIIFLDLNMPYLSGYEFIEQYEALYAASFPNTRLIILTSSVLDKDSNTVRKHKVVEGFFTKPLEEVHLMQIKNKIEGK